MKLSIITINYNNAEGLRRTLASVASQTFRDFEHIIVDGGSTDGSVEIIEAYASDVVRSTNSCVPTGGDGCYAAVYGKESTLAEGAQPYKVRWLSEPDSGIYNAMNKGIEMALGKRVVNSFNRSELVEDKNKGIKMANGEYLLFLNSGDSLVDPKTLIAVIDNGLNVDIVYGNSLLHFIDGTIKKGEYATVVTGKTLFNHTIPHQASFIKSTLFNSIGLYSEDLRFGSDWEFYLKAFFYHNCSFRYIDIDICLFDMTGISTNPNLSQKMLDERVLVLKRIIPQLYADYEEMNDNVRYIGTIDTKALKLGQKMLKPYRMLKKLFVRK